MVLRPIQKPLSDEDKVFWLSNGLGLKYERSVTSL